MKKTDMIIFAGQSNMQGQTEGLPEDNTTVGRAYEYRYAEDICVPLKHPVGENLTVDGKAETVDFTDLHGALQNCALLASWENSANMVPAFCRSYISETDHHVVAVHTAKGSSDISLWQPGEVCYEGMCLKIRAAMRKVQPDSLYIVWLQGESDAILGKSREYYMEKLANLNCSLREQFPIKKFGIILVGEFTKDERDQQIIRAQKDICRENDGFLMLTTATEELVHRKEYMNPKVAGHYSILGQEYLGTAAGKALGQYEITGNIAVPVSPVGDVF